MSTKAQLAERQEAIEKLRTWIKPGATIYTILRHRSSSGMSRSISLFTIMPGFGGEPEMQRLDGYATKALGCTLDHKRDGLKVSGAGMDMGYHLVYSLGRVLFPNGYLPSEAGKSGRNQSADNEHDADGGYALCHRWL